MFSGGCSRWGTYNPFCDQRVTRRSPLENAQIARALETIATLAHFESTKLSELRFRALLADGVRELRFERTLAD